jgi:hypothetical protein
MSQDAPALLPIGADVPGYLQPPIELANTQLTLNTNVNYQFAIYPRDNQSNPIWARNGRQTVFHIELDGPERRVVMATQRAPTSIQLDSELAMDWYSFDVIVGVPGMYQLAVGVREYEMDRETCRIVAPCVFHQARSQLRGSPFRIRYRTRVA